MSSTISPSNPNTLATALLSVGKQSASQSSPTPDGSADGVNLDTLQLSGSSVSDLESQAQEIAQQNQDSVISTSEDALAANLQAVQSILSGSGSAQAAQGSPDASTVAQLTL